MRNLLMIGTATCHPPYADGVEAWVPELAAHMLFGTGEMTYVNPADFVSDARAGELHAARRMAALAAWADLGVCNSIDPSVPNPYLSPPEPDAVEVFRRYPPRPTTKAAVYG